MQYDCTLIYQHSTEPIRRIGVSFFLFPFRTSQAREFLQQRIDYLLPLLQAEPEDAYSVHLSLATCYHMLGNSLRDTSNALEHARKAMEAAAVGDRREVEWLLELLHRQLAVEERKEEGRREIEEWSQERVKMPVATKVKLLVYVRRDSFEGG